MERFLVKLPQHTQAPPKVMRISSEDIMHIQTKSGGVQTFNAQKYEIPKAVPPQTSSSTSTVGSKDKGLDLPEELSSRMYDHQREGVQWMFELRHLPYRGGILGDDMGLGKTFQTVCLLTGLIRSQLGSRFIIIAPVAVLPTWVREIEQHAQPYCKRLSIVLINSEMTKSRRIQSLKQIAGTIFPCIVVSSYQLVTNMVDEFSDIKWDYAILDEGHTIRNPATQLFKAMHRLRTEYRLLLTGTPVQNKLKELWALMDWVTKGRLFGSQHGFSEKYVDHINRGQDPRAPEECVKIAKIVAENLMKTIQPVLLQRKKCEKQDILKLPDKVELVIWIPLATQQREMYQEYLSTRAFKEIVRNADFPIEAVTHLKSLCRHPLLLEASKIKKNLLAGKSSSVDDLTFGLQSLSIQRSKSFDIGEEKENSFVKNGSKSGKNEDLFSIIGRRPSTEELFSGSIKLRVLLKLIRKLKSSGHKILVFSQSRLMHDIIQTILAEYGISSCRIDGNVPGPDRQVIIDAFNDERSHYSVCLLTTKACGFGLTLTGADRVIIYDPSWNPGEDRQAVDRAFRIGQTRDVIVYRMIMASAIEEKMYEKQVFKDGLRVVTESGVSSKYFSSEETTALFKLGPKDKSEVMFKLWEMSKSSDYRTIPDITEPVKGVLGVSRHDTLYEELRPKEIQERKHVLSLQSSIISPVDDSSTHRAFVVKTPKPKVGSTQLNPLLNVNGMNENRINDDDEEFEWRKPSSKSSVASPNIIVNELEYPEPANTQDDFDRYNLVDEEEKNPIQINATASRKGRVIFDDDSEDECHKGSFPDLEKTREGNSTPLLDSRQPEFILDLCGDDDEIPTIEHTFIPHIPVDVAVGPFTSPVAIETSKNSATPILIDDQCIEGHQDVQEDNYVDALVESTKSLAIDARNIDDSEECFSEKSIRLVSSVRRVIIDSDDECEEEKACYFENVQGTGPLPFKEGDDDEEFRILLSESDSSDSDISLAEGEEESRRSGNFFDPREQISSEKNDEIDNELELPVQESETIFKFTEEVPPKTFNEKVILDCDDDKGHCTHLQLPQGQLTADPDEDFQILLSESDDDEEDDIDNYDNYDHVDEEEREVDEVFYHEKDVVSTADICSKSRDIEVYITEENMIGTDLLKEAMDNESIERPWCSIAEEDKLRVSRLFSTAISLLGDTSLDCLSDDTCVEAAELLYSAIEICDDRFLIHEKLSELYQEIQCRSSTLIDNSTADEDSLQDEI